MFNPQDLVFGGHEDSSNSGVMGEIRSADSSSYFSVPVLKATAVPNREGEAIMRKTTAGQTGRVTWNPGGHAATPEIVSYRLTDRRRMNWGVRPRPPPETAPDDFAK